MKRSDYIKAETKAKAEELKTLALGSALALINLTTIYSYYNVILRRAFF